MFLGKAVDDELGNQLVATMLYLDSENKKDINIYINCSGGEVFTMLHITSIACCCGVYARYNAMHCSVPTDRGSTELKCFAF